MTKPRQSMPDYDLLHSLFEYKDGALYNRTTRNSRAIAGAKAGSYSGKYALITVNGMPWHISRIIYFMHYKNVPDCIDHINGDAWDNRIENLRPATYRQNQFNHAKTSANKSGVKGVSWTKKYNKWYACIRINGVAKNLGYYADIEDAKEFIELVRSEVHGSFANHGEFKGELNCQSL